MKKFFAFLLAFLIVVGIYLFMKKQANPSNEVPAGVKTILWLEKPQQNIADEKKTNEVPKTEENKNPSQDDALVIKDSEATSGSAEPIVSWQQMPINNEQPTVIPSQEAVQATGTSAPTGNTQEDDGLTPLQRAIKARNAAK